MKAQGFADEESYHRKCMKETELEEAERWTEAYQRELQNWKKQKITGTAIEGERKERYSADQTGNERSI